ncbi:MAG: hypothetical protein HY081_11660 [Gammaproteobacteria bacterium]|nr:hypothetical protein [Gammaproteobacteria bacterium]
MQPRNWIGLVIILVGVMLQPIGWMYIFWVQILSFMLIFIGVFIFATQKFLEKSVEKELASERTSSRTMPGDIQDHSGWGEGGRSESWSSDHGGGDGGGSSSGD